MLSSPQSEKELDGASNALKPVAVRKQLKRLLAHPLFTNSKRYPVLLAYTVEQTLLGNAGELKERTIGIKAFGREPIYDVALDPVVRTTAAEVRKRLIQYYYSPEHAGELIIEMPTGSYVPTFREPVVLHDRGGRRGCFGADSIATFCRCGGSACGAQSPPLGFDWSCTGGGFAGRVRPGTDEAFGRVVEPGTFLGAHRLCVQQDHILSGHANGRHGSSAIQTIAGHAR